MSAGAAESTSTSGPLRATADVTDDRVPEAPSTAPDHMAVIHPWTAPMGLTAPV